MYSETDHRKRKNVISTNRQRALYVATDFITANIAVFLFDIVRFHVLGSMTTGFSGLSAFLSAPILVAEQIILPVIVLLVNALSGYYNKPFRNSYIQDVVVSVGSSFFNMLFIYFALLVNNPTAIRRTSYILLFYLFFLLFFMAIAGRLAVTALTYRKMRRRELSFDVLLTGNNPRGRAAAENIRRNFGRTGYNLVGIAALPGEESGEGVIPFDELPALCSSRKISEIFVVPEKSDAEHMATLLHRLFPLAIPLKITPEALPVLNSSIKLQSIYEEPFVDVSNANISECTRTLKRVADICISATALALLALPMGVIALLVKRDSPGAAIYRQDRIGYRGRRFRICKFRTMRTDAEAQGPQLSSENDPRITSLGRCLRKYRLDELPQFWNVLRGDMSLVGPRPEREYFIRQIMERAPQYTLLHQIRPGITSWGMVKYGYASSVDEMVKRLNFDLIYLANVSMAVDLKILIYTVKTVVKGRGK